MKIGFILWIGLLVAGAAYGRGTDDAVLPAAAAFDIRRFMGDWYEIARYDHAFERGLAEVCTSYRLVSDGKIEVVNRGTVLKNGRRKVSRGRARRTSHPGRLRVSFSGFISIDYRILDRGCDYEWVLVGSSSARYLWILSRTPRLPALTLNRILRLAEQRGYRLDRLLFVDQEPGGATM